jgi:ribosomal protein S19
MIRWKIKPSVLHMTERFVGKEHSRSLIVTPSYVGLYLKVSTGKSLEFLEIRPYMVGFKLGDFIRTKKIGDVHKLHKRSSGYRRKKKR